ncbi:XRE family transcriptional regulator [Rhizobacter sp. SG703]|uniref:XRE family transcriptional regulator n=1 Tax=Rhizobacter sp. SG703 TaxID=2587140 RepID=UPI0017A2B7A0|nr:transcriptional regulator with XRE-family HTH domain [Rhizobacter sp. SG703]
MSKASLALTQLPPSTVAALEQLGADLAVARLRRKESLKTWAQRMGVSVPTLLRLEAGEPGVSVGVLATALWLIGRDAALAGLATPLEDRGAIELDVRQAEALGRERAQATAQAKLQRASKRQRGSGE